ncbi:uncharacterized protein LOC133739070 [Rosa rugosa]|uniref:uncharacterized protein LOC133739070 n=1 Tax=Rosa rugosa TaxID=74645 RepID=UPI002B417B9C|nr:uncharacterized protein LOC133739070 [Rosa rugosa]
MGSTLERKRVRLIEDDSRVDNECDELVSLVQHGHDNVDVRCLDYGLHDDMDPRSKLLLEHLRGDGLLRRIKRRCISSEDEDPQYKLFLENLREDGNSYAFEVVQENGVSELIRYHQEGGYARRIMRRCISKEDEDPQYKLFLENLREDGNSYAFEVVQENGVSELIRYHQEGGYARRIMRRCISKEDVDPQYALFLESLREDGNSYALEVVREGGISELISYHQDNGLGRRVKRTSVCNKKLENLMLVDNCENTLSSVKHGNDEDEHSGDDNSDIRSVDDSYNGHGFTGDDCDVRSVDDGDNGTEHSSDDDIDFKSVHDGDNWNEQSSDDNVHVKSLGDDVMEPKSKLFLENLREDENMNAQEIVQETGILEHIKHHQNNGLPDEPSLAATEPMKNSLMKDKTQIENRFTLESLKDLPKRKSSVVKKNAELAALDPAFGMANGVSTLASKRPCLEVPNNPEELNSDTPETLKSPQVKEKPVIENRDILKLIEKFREKRSSAVKKNAKLEILNPVSSRTRGHSSKRPHLEAHNTPESFISLPLREKMETKRTLRLMKKEKVKINRPKKSAHLLNEEETKGPKTLRNKRSESLQSLEDLQEKKSSRVKKNVKGEAKYPYSYRKNELPNKRPGSEVLHFANCGGNDFAKCDRNGDDETESYQTDESYQTFLSLLEINDENMTCAPQNGRPETYDVDIKDENAESSSDSDLIVLERDPVDTCRTPIKKDSENDLESRTKFKEGLIKDLKRPYDPQELLKLLEDWSCQRPATGHAKNFRSGVIKTYALKGEYGKPYLEVYKDLAEMIKASDRPGSLNLLRGFFYWLKNVAQEGSFEPWSDVECLNVVQQL